MVVRCFQCNGLLRVDENSLPFDRRAKVRCPHCKSIGLMPEQPAAHLATGDPNAAAPGDADYPALLPVQVPPPPPPKPPDWKEAAIPHDAFNSFRYPGDRNAKASEKKPPTAPKKWALVAWVVVSVAVVAFFALLVNLILPGPAGVSPAVYTVPSGPAPPSGVTEENIDSHRNSAAPSIQDRR